TTDGAGEIFLPTETLEDGIRDGTIEACIGRQQQTPGTKCPEGVLHSRNGRNASVNGDEIRGELPVYLVGQLFFLDEVADDFPLGSAAPLVDLSEGDGPAMVGQ